MTDDLVKRLRRTYRKEFAPTGSMVATPRTVQSRLLSVDVLFNPDGAEAADHIEALTAENERLREALRGVTPPAHFGESEQSKSWWAKARAALGEKQ